MMKKMKRNLKDLARWDLVLEWDLVLDLEWFLNPEWDLDLVWLLVQDLL